MAQVKTVAVGDLGDVSSSEDNVVAALTGSEGQEEGEGGVT